MLTELFIVLIACRGGGIRTHDLYVPNVARYQAALHPEWEGKDKAFVCLVEPENWFFLQEVGLIYPGRSVGVIRWPLIPALRNTRTLQNNDWAAYAANLNPLHKAPNRCSLTVKSERYTNSSSRFGSRFMASAGSVLPNHFIRTFSLIQYIHGTNTSVSTVENVRP